MHMCRYRPVKRRGMHLRPNIEFLMLVVSCMSWNCFMTTGWLMTVLQQNKLMRYKHWQKELKIFGCVLPDKFVAGCIIAKLPRAWTNFATSLKYKRQEFDITDLIGSLDVEEKARAKDVCAKKLLREVLVPTWCRKILNTPTRRNFSKNSNKRTLHLLRRRRKRRIVSLMASMGIMLRIVRMASGSPRRNLQT